MFFYYYSLPSTLNVGFTEEVFEQFKLLYGERFALNIYWIFIQSFGMHVLGMKSRPFREVINKFFTIENVHSVNLLSTEALQQIVMEFKALIDIPNNPYEQVSLVIESIYRGLTSKRLLFLLKIYITFYIGNFIELGTIVY